MDKTRTTAAAILSCMISIILAIFPFRYERFFVRRKRIKKKGKLQPILEYIMMYVQCTSYRYSYLEYFLIIIRFAFLI